MCENTSGTKGSNCRTESQVTRFVLRSAKRKDSFSAILFGWFWLVHNHARFILASSCMLALANTRGCMSLCFLQQKAKGEKANKKLFHAKIISRYAPAILMKNPFDNVQANPKLSLLDTNCGRQRRLLHWLLSNAVCGFAQVYSYRSLEALPLTSGAGLTRNAVG